MRSKYRVLETWSRKDGQVVFVPQKRCCLFFWEDINTYALPSKEQAEQFIAAHIPINKHHYDV